MLPRLKSFKTKYLKGKKKSFPRVMQWEGFLEVAGKPTVKMKPLLLCGRENSETHHLPNIHLLARPSYYSTESWRNQHQIAGVGKYAEILNRFKTDFDGTLSHRKSPSQLNLHKSSRVTRKNLIILSFKDTLLSVQ